MSETLAKDGSESERENYSQKCGLEKALANVRVLRNYKESQQIPVFNQYGMGSRFI